VGAEIGRSPSRARTEHLPGLHQVERPAGVELVTRGKLSENLFMILVGSCEVSAQRVCGAPKCTHNSLSRKLEDCLVTLGAAWRPRLSIERELWQVRVPVDTETGKWKVIGTLRAGETFGEVSLTVGAKSMASVITAEPCCFVEVKYDDCEGLLLSRSTTHLNTPQTWTISK
jgi:hypothetical protein